MSWFSNILASITNLFKKPVVNPPTPAPVTTQPVPVTVVAPTAVPTAAVPLPQVILAPTPAPIVAGSPARDVNVIGPQVTIWALQQTDNFGNKIGTPAHPEIGVNGVTYIATYVAGHLDIPVDTTGFETAYQAVKDTPIISVQGFPMGTVGAPATGQSPRVPSAPTDAVASKVAIYDGVCTQPWDKVGYLLVVGNNDLFNYLVNNRDMSFFNPAYDATRAGQYDNVDNIELGHPRVWEQIPGQ